MLQSSEAWGGPVRKGYTQQVVLQESPVGGRRPGKTPRRGKGISDTENSTGKCMQIGKCMLSLPKLFAKFQRGKCMKNTQGKSSWGSMGVGVCRRKMGNREVKKSWSCCLLNDANSASIFFTSAFIKTNQINTASCINSIWRYTWNLTHSHQRKSLYVASSSIIRSLTADQGALVRLTAQQTPTWLTTCEFLLSSWTGYLFPSSSQHSLDLAFNSLVVYWPAWVLPPDILLDLVPKPN